MPWLVPGLTRSVFEPSSVGHLHLGAAQRLGDRQRHLDLEVLALALEHGRGSDVRDHVQVAGRPAVAARLALAGQADAAALAHAGGDVDAHFLTVRTAPAPWQVGQGSSITVPEPPQREQGWEIENMPWPWLPRCRAPRSADTPFGVVPGLAPVPWQVGQVSCVGTDSGICAPEIAWSKEIDTWASRSPPRCARARRSRATPAAPARAAPDAAEQVGEDVAHVGGVEVEVAKAAEPAAGPAAGRERARAAVVLLALLGVAQHVVGLGDLLEALLGLLSSGLRSGWYWRASLR